MTLPTIHLNGTSAEILIADIMAARCHLESAYEAIQKTAPNSRDYYTQGPDALAAAIAEHRERLKRVYDVSQELYAMAMGIQDAE